MSLTTAIPADGAVAALAGFDLMTASRLRVLLAHHDPADAYAVAAGRAAPSPIVADLLSPRLRAAWARSADQRPPDEWAARCRASGVRVVTERDPAYPGVLHLDPDPPAALFVRGDLGTLDARRVGIVGTRNATRFGRDTAARFGEVLAAAGVAVVSGLAKGIDGAAHRGALRCDEGRVVAVVGNGPDVAYPRQHADLWQQVCERGVLVSEWPPGTVPEPFRFPQRNRILAALSEVLVVVESRERGGSLITAQAALERDITVMAVPGSLQNRAALGTNQLIRDGAQPVTEVSDILVALGLDGRRAAVQHAFDPRPLPRGVDAVVLERCGRDPCTIDQVVSDLGLSLADAAMALARLERAGWVRGAGGWFEPVARWGDR